MHTYGIAINWSFEILTSKGYSHELLPNKHLADIKRRVFMDKRENNQMGVTNAWNLIALLKAIIYNGIEFYVREEQEQYSIDFGEAIKYKFKFPDQIVVQSSDFELPQNASFSGGAMTSIPANFEGGMVKARYTSRFLKFTVQEIDNLRADRFLTVFPNRKISVTLSRNFARVHLLQLIMALDEDQETTRIKRTQVDETVLT